MPYTHKKIGDKYVVFKGTKRVGETGGTKTALNKYLAALHIADKNTLNESAVVEAASGLVDEVGAFWVVTTAGEESVLADVLFESNVLDFASRVKGGLVEADVLGIYVEEAKATKVAEDKLKAIQTKLKEVEGKKGQITGQIEEIIKKLQKEINLHLEAGNQHEQAEGKMSKIKELREKSKIVEFSKKPLEEKSDKPTK